MSKEISKAKAALTREINAQLDYLNDILECAHKQEEFETKGWFRYFGQTLTKYTIQVEMHRLSHLRWKRQRLNLQS